MVEWVADMSGRQDMGNELKQLEQESTELSKVLVKDTSAWQHKKEVGSYTTSHTINMHTK